MFETTNQSMLTFTVVLRKLQWLTSLSKAPCLGVLRPSARRAGSRCCAPFPRRKSHGNWYQELGGIYATSMLCYMVILQTIWDLKWKYLITIYVWPIFSGLNFREYPHNSCGLKYGTNVPLAQASPRLVCKLISYIHLDATRDLTGCCPSQ